MARWVEAEAARTKGVDVNHGGGLELPGGVRPGEIVDGKYSIERVLGVGGMGVVVAARHVSLDHRVAIKFLMPSLLVRQQAVARFAREARAAVKITCENVARVFDVGTLPNGIPYMVMEFLEGAVIPRTGSSGEARCRSNRRSSSSCKRASPSPMPTAWASSIGT